jgi:hypothetical protein
MPASAYRSHTCERLYNDCVKQLNLNVTPAFDKDLRVFMRRKGIANKSEAIRRALHDAVTKTSGKETDFRSWLGMGLKAPLNPRPQFRTEDDLWS